MGIDKKQTQWLVGILCGLAALIALVWIYMNYGA